MKKSILLILSLASFVFASCEESNCGCQKKESEKIKCENKNDCDKSNCSNKIEEHKCGSEKNYQSDVEKTISNTNYIIENK